MELAERMRCENYEQFQTLVRMHLSFELDLNIDTADVDGIHKPKPKKRFNFPIKSKHLSSSSSSSSSASTSSSSKFAHPPFNIKHSLNANGIEQIQKIIRFLVQEQSIIQEGIFRRTGSMARQHDLRRRINEQSELNLDSGTYTVHDCASVLKGILADLPEPLLTDYFYTAYCQIADLCNSKSESKQAKEPRLLHTIQLLLLLLPLENRTLLNDIICMLNEITKHESENKMSAESLATLFTPHLICPRKLSPEALHTISQNLSGIISFMITKAKELHDIPPKLDTDIRAYFLEQKRKRVLSPDVQMLDESVTSDSTANTVYTFVDREKTAEAHITNPTDTALAQLYAYIQTLPESSKKRKLIKQFNKENGQGTPLQQQMLMRLKNGTNNPPRSNKSLSGSIKKHIFHNTLVSRTPKRAPVPVVSNTTPVARRDLEEKTNARLIFHTPGNESNKSLTDTGNSLKNNLSTLIKTPNVPTINETNADECNSVPDISVTQQPSPQEIQTDATEPDESNHSLSGASKHHTNPIIPRIEVPPSITTDSTDKFHTPNSFNMHKFVTCFKSEPNLSKVLKEKNRSSTPIMHRGRFIARKLLSGVSMINLRFPFTGHSSHEKLADKNIETDFKLHDNIDIADASESRQQMDVFRVNNENNVSSDVLDGYKENLLCINETKGLALTNKKDISLIKADKLSDSIGRDSVSPITKSTHRMPKAMQESIMTPRSRKPVIISAMLNMTADNYNNKSFLNYSKNEDGDIGLLNSSQQLFNSPLQKSKSESEILDALSSPHRGTQLLAPEEAFSIKLSNSTSEEALSTPFRKYLFSRSLLMATPVDSSFSSQSDDFENLNDSEMNESLIYCLDGNEPEFLSSDSIYYSTNMDNIDSPLPPIQRHYNYNANGADDSKLINDTINSSLCRKRHTTIDENINSEYTKMSNSLKKKIIHLDETAL